MNLPKFTAESALSKSTRTYRGSPQFGSFSQSGVPAIAVHPSQDESEGLDDADEAGLEADAADGGEEDTTEENSEEGDNGEGEVEASEEGGEEADEG